MACRFLLLLLVGCLTATMSVSSATAQPLHQRIDAHVETVCRQRGIPLADLTEDAQFVRRAYLDLTGIIPPADAVRTFIACPENDKRSRLIDRLLASPEYPLHMARVFDVMLLERRIATIKSYDVSQAAWRAYLADSFASNKPWHQLVQEILNSDGTDAATGAGAKFFLVRDTEPHPLTRDVGRLLLGVDLQCAQCHDDPRYEDYKQADYYGIYAFVNRLEHFRDEETKRSLLQEKAVGGVQFTSAFTGLHGRTNPRLPGGEMLADPAFVKGEEYQVQPAKGVRGVPKYSRQQRLAEQLPRAETPGFSRNIANRLWAHMLGRGLVHPLDLSHQQNPPSHPALLDLLAKSLEASNYDLKRFLRDIARSRTYQRSSRSAAVSPQGHAFEKALLRALSPEQLGWSILQATGFLDRKINAAAAKLAQDQVSADPHWKTRVYLECESVADEFVRVFQGLPGQADGSFEPSVDQSLFLLNAQRMVELLDIGEGTLVDQLSRLETTEEIAAQIFVCLLSRYPTRDEQVWVDAQLPGHLGVSRRDVLRQLVWGLLLSAEFRLHH